MPALNRIPKGEFFKRKATAKTVYVKGGYDRGSRSFECHDTEDVNRTIWLKATTEVVTDFEY